MLPPRSEDKVEQLQQLLSRDHSLNGAILFGLEGYLIEIQARAMAVLRRASSWREATTISGMARGAVYESLDRIAGAFAKYQIPQPEVEILIKLRCKEDTPVSAE